MPDRLIPTTSAIGDPIATDRLTLRPWRPEDAEPALAVYGTDQVARWLSPAMQRVPDAAAMRGQLERWNAESAELDAPQGRWAVERTDDGAVLGGVALLPLPPDGDDLELAWQLDPAVWGQGYATEAGRALARRAYDAGVEEVFAVVRRRNDRGAATARRVGMEWVGETEKYYGLRLQVFRLRAADLSA